MSLQRNNISTDNNARRRAKKRLDSIAHMAARVDKLQGPENVFTWLRSARGVHPLIGDKEALLYRQAGWSVDDMLQYTKEISARLLPFPSYVSVKNEELVAQAFCDGEAPILSPRKRLNNEEAHPITILTKEGHAEKKNRVNAWVPFYCKLESSILHFYDKQEQTEVDLRGDNTHGHTYQVSQFEALCRHGTDIHIFRARGTGRGKILKLRLPTCQKALEWLTILAAVAGHQTKKSSLRVKSKFVLELFMEQMAYQINHLREDLQHKTINKVQAEAEKHKKNLQILYSKLEQQIAAKAREYEALEKSFQEQKMPHHTQEKENHLDVVDTNKNDVVNIVGGFEVDNLDYLDREYKSRIKNQISAYLDGKIDYDDPVLLNSNFQGRSDKEEKHLSERMLNAVPDLDVQKSRDQIQSRVGGAKILNELNTDFEQRRKILLDNLQSQHMAAKEPERERYNELFRIANEEVQREAKARKARMIMLLEEKRKQTVAQRKLKEIRQQKKIKEEYAAVQERLNRLRQSNNEMHLQIVDHVKRETKLKAKLVALHEYNSAQTSSTSVLRLVAPLPSLPPPQEKAGRLIAQIKEMCATLSKLIKNRTENQQHQAIDNHGAKNAYNVMHERLQEQRAVLVQMLPILSRWQADIYHHAGHIHGKTKKTNMKKYKNKNDLKVIMQNDTLRKYLSPVVDPIAMHSKRLQQMINVQEQANQYLLKSVKDWQFGAISAAVAKLNKRIGDLTIHDYWNGLNRAGTGTVLDPLPFMVHGSKVWNSAELTEASPLANQVYQYMLSKVVPQAQMP